MQRQPRRPDRTHPPGAQPQHHQASVSDRSGHSYRAAHDRQHQGFSDQQFSQLRNSEAGGAKDSDLAETLFNAEAKEQDSKKECRSDEEETEVGKVFAEIRGTA